MAAVAAAALLAPAGIAVGHEPGNACESQGASGGEDAKNPHCADDHGVTTALANRGSDRTDEDDPDGDGDVGDDDNCPNDYNPRQLNDGEVVPDGHGNVCDHANDLNGNGGCDADCDGLDPKPGEPGSYGHDTDGDGVVDEEEDTPGPTPQEQLEAGIEDLSD